MVEEEYRSESVRSTCWQLCKELSLLRMCWRMNVVVEAATKSIEPEGGMTQGPKLYLLA